MNGWVARGLKLGGKGELDMVVIGKQFRQQLTGFYKAGSAN